MDFIVCVTVLFLQAESDSPVTTSTLATDLRRQKLYTMFPGVDKVALDELLQANRCDVRTIIVCFEHIVCLLPRKSLSVVAGQCGCGGECGAVIATVDTAK